MRKSIYQGGYCHQGFGRGRSLWLKGLSWSTPMSLRKNQQQERLVRGLAFGGVSPGWAGGAVEGGEVFDRGCEDGHGFQIIYESDYS